MIISYEMLLREIKEVKKCSFDIVITDESHRLKNASSKTAQARALTLPLLHHSGPPWICSRERGH